MIVNYNKLVFQTFRQNNNNHYQTRNVYCNYYCMKNKHIKTAARVALGSMLIIAGISHLTFARKQFRAQVPGWVPLKKDDTVVYSGIAEIALGSMLASSSKAAAGKLAAIFFTAVFPGNISQYVHHRNAFGLDTDKKRLARLFFQPVLIWWALKSTGK